MTRAELTIDSAGEKTVLAAKAKINGDMLVFFCETQKISVFLDKVLVATPEYQLVLSATLPSQIKFFKELAGVSSPIYCHDFSISLGSPAEFFDTKKLEICTNYSIATQAMSLKITAKLQ